MTVEPWMLGVLVTLNVAVLTAFGGVIWAAYRIASDIRVSLYGTEEEGGFVEASRDATDELAEDQEHIARQLKLQGRLLNKLVYAFTDLVDALDDEVEHDIDTQHVEDLNDRVTDDRWRNEDD